jgi:hypothetical protein
VRALKVSFYAYPLINALHIMAIGVVFSAVVMMDLRILGVVRSVARAPFLHLMREAIAVAFPIAIATGLLLFSIRAQEYATNAAFQMKLMLLVLAGINLAAFRRMMVEPASDDVDYSGSAKAMAAASLALWTGIVVAGRFIGFI